MENNKQSIYELLNTFRENSTDFTDNFCIVNGEPLPLQNVESMGFNEFAIRSKINMPRKLYKYFPNTSTYITDPETHRRKKINYSHRALQSNEVYLNSPANFDDVYDSNIFVDWEKYLLARLNYYISFCDIDIAGNSDLSHILYVMATEMFNAVQNEQNIVNAFKRSPIDEGAKLAIENFALSVFAEVTNGSLWQEAIVRTIRNEYQKLCGLTQETFRISCFATTPFSQLMWGGSYADCHRGFCIEYDVLPDDSKYSEIFQNLFPVVYSKTRSEITSELLHWQDANITDSSLWHIYFNGLLRKSFDWAYQNEWRLLQPTKAEIKGFSVPFFPISKVYLGNRMNRRERTKIIKICKEQNIPYVGVRRTDDRFEMCECPIKCEVCPQYTSTAKL